MTINNIHMLLCTVCSSLSIPQYIINKKYLIYRCSTCQYIFVNPKPTHKELDNYYNKFDYKDSDSFEKRIRRDAKQSIYFIRKSICTDSNVLDVGCGRGYFLDELLHAGWKNVVGIDFSSSVIKYARQKLGLKVYKESIYRFRSQKKFSLIILNQVIEHVHDINLLINISNTLLLPKGYLYIATPNMMSASALLFKDRFEHIIPPEHLNFFSINNLTYLLKKHGFQIVAVGTWGYPENMVGIVKKLINPNVEMTIENKTRINLQEKKRWINIKYIIFDKLFCHATYRLLDIFNKGINLQIIAQKK